MTRSLLRIYHGPESDPAPVLQESAPSQNSVTLPLSEVFPLLADAVRSQRTWLRDFEDDEITISSDLYEVIAAYNHLRPSA